MVDTEKTTKTLRCNRDQGVSFEYHLQETSVNPRLAVRNKFLVQSESLRDYFSKFGEITEVMVMKDPTTRRSSSTAMGLADSSAPLYSRPRGFGFITFGDPASVDKVLAHGTHELDGKKIDPKVAFPRRAHPKVSGMLCNALSR
uniref:RNA-binding protein Musashi homolog Rbp6 n=2 Tax=Culex pipiens TaxID=7175 RepID=A0A8D8MWS3_CULPI